MRSSRAHGDDGAHAPGFGVRQDADTAPHLTWRDGAFHLRRAMREAVGAAARDVARDAGARRTGGAPRAFLVLDVGGRDRPYAEVVRGHLEQNGLEVRHRVVDAGGGGDIVGRAEALPLASRSVDLVLCTQVMEHVAEPGLAIGEMARVLKPGGRGLLTTHGTWFYHPDPEDYWRWTSAGLAALFRAGGFRDVTVRPVGGTKLAISVLALTAMERASGDGLAGSLMRTLVVPPANLAVSLLVRGRIMGRHNLPGDLVINYIVDARSPS